jgi:hypothetical protein
VGATEKCDPGDWNGDPAPTFTYRWFSGDDPVPGATSASYIVRAVDVGEVITCRVTASNDAGRMSADAPGLIGHMGNQDPPASTKLVLKGKPKVGQQLSAGSAVWNFPGLELHFQWLRDGHTIPHAVKATYKVTKRDRTHKITCLVTAKLFGFLTSTTTSKAVKVA